MTTNAERPYDPATVLTEARLRFARDAEFHAQVEQVVRVVEEDCFQMSGSRLTRDENGAATVAAAVALHLAANAGSSTPEGT